MEKHDKYYLELAKKVSERSKDPSTKIGAVIVDKDGNFISAGFNGFPKKMADVSELYLNREEKLSRIIHAEMNALILSKRDVAGGTLYTWPLMGCDRCVVHLIQAGITRFVSPKMSGDVVDRWAPLFIKTKKYFEECNVEFEEIEL